jgi:threonine/homoserine/homoserine lactone efflux protein
MFGIHDYPAFLGLSIALHAVPGQDMLFILAQGLRGGPRPAAIAALGIGVGSLLFAIATALGVGLLVTAYSGALQAIRFTGAGYLAYLGTRSLVAAWRAYRSPAAIGLRASVEGAAFRDGLITNMSNVKVLVFFWSFLPSFVDANGVTLGWGLLLLG